MSSRPEGYIDSNGTILRRPAAGQPDITVEVSARITETATGKAENVVMGLPLSAVYQGPAVNVRPADVAAAKQAYLENKFGFFVHYVPRFTVDRSGSAVDDIDALAGRFDAAQFAQDMRDFGADYVIFTVWHFNAVTLYPSAVNKRWRDDRRVSPGFKSYSERDLIADMAAELSRCGVDLHLYCHPVDGHDFTAEDQELTGWNDCGGNANGDHSRWNQFQNELYDELCRRYAGTIKGLWFDGLYLHSGKNHPMIDHGRFRETLLAYDPGLILVANIGDHRSADILAEFTSADYGAWELDGDITRNLGFRSVNPDVSNSDAATWPVTAQQPAMIIGPAEWIATKVDPGIPLPHSREELFRYLVLQSSISVSGGLAFAAGCFPDHGNIWEGSLKEDLTYLNKTYLAPVAASIKGTVPGKAYVTPEKSWLNNMAWGVSTESPDGSIIYLHVMKPPAGSRTLHIGPAADGSELESGALVLNYDGSTSAAAVTKTGDGYDITLPDGTDWHILDTVVQVCRSATARANGSGQSR
ncbi:MAG: alpha-L-fucosidase [Treponema sp.]|nr:alpha-L-fucosidase [Treponema sp.]